jgi:hypothetical protein
MKKGSLGSLLICSQAVGLVATATTEPATTTAAAAFTTTAATATATATAAAVGATETAATTATFTTATTVAAAAATFATATTVATAAAAFTTATTVAATTTTTETTGAGRTYLHGTRFVDDDVATTQRCAIHAFNSGQCFSIAAHFDETKTFRATRVALHHDFGAGHRTELSK